MSRPRLHAFPKEAYEYSRIRIFDDTGFIYSAVPYNGAQAFSIPPFPTVSMKGQAGVVIETILRGVGGTEDGVTVTF